MEGMTMATAVRTAPAWGSDEACGDSLVMRLLDRSEVDRELTRAYLNARFRAPGLGLDFRVADGRPLNGWPDDAASVAILTAANPLSQRRSAAENEAANRELAARIEALGLPCEPALGSAPDGSWSEPSLLVVGATLAEAVGLGREFGQNAIVWAGSWDRTPRVALLR